MVLLIACDQIQIHTHTQINNKPPAVYMLNAEGSDKMSLKIYLFISVLFVSKSFMHSLRCVSFTLRSIHYKTHHTEEHEFNLIMSFILITHAGASLVHGATFIRIAYASKQQWVQHQQTSLNANEMKWRDNHLFIHFLCIIYHSTRSVSYHYVCCCCAFAVIAVVGCVATATFRHFSFFQSESISPRHSILMALCAWTHNYFNAKEFLKCSVNVYTRFDLLRLFLYYLMPAVRAYITTDNKLQLNVVFAHCIIHVDMSCCAVGYNHLFCFSHRMQPCLLYKYCVIHYFANYIFYPQFVFC